MNRSFALSIVILAIGLGPANADEPPTVAIGGKHGGDDGMGVQVHKHFFDAREEVLDDLKKTGFWPTTYVSEPGPPGDIHWHNLEVHGYVLDGHTWFLDVDNDIRHDIASGDKIVIPARTLHAEGGITENVIYIIGLPEPGPFDPFLEQRSPEDLKK